MFSKLLPILLISFSPFHFLEDLNDVETYSTDFEVNENVLIKVNDTSADYVRIYRSSGITSIALDAFQDCHFSRIMISNNVLEINDNFPDTLTTLEFTGSKQDINFAVPEGIEIKEYACDEGFLNYWTTYIRPNISGSICDVTKQDYLKMKQLYAELNVTDKETINAYDDGSSNIADSIEFLDDNFNSSPRNNIQEADISQSMMLTLILIIASFGMTSIGIFYFLKDKNVIE